jgi:hypothetical protein
VSNQNHPVGTVKIPRFARNDNIIIVGGAALNIVTT